MPGPREDALKRVTALLGECGLRPTTQTRTCGHDVGHYLIFDVWVGQGKVVIVQRYVTDHDLTGFEVFVQATPTNSVQDTLDALAKHLEVA